MAHKVVDSPLLHDNLTRRMNLHKWGRRAVDLAAAAGKPIDAASVHHWIGKTASDEVDELRTMNPELYQALCYETAVEVIASIVRRAMRQIN